MPESNSNGDTFDQWAIVDVMGHQRYIGHVTQQVIAGTGFVRVDVPATSANPAWTKLIGTGSIYAITPVSEEIARGMAEESLARPIAKYELPASLRPRLASATLDTPASYDGRSDDDDESWGNETT